MFSWFVSFYIYILNLKLKKVTTSLTGGIKKPFSEVALQTRESLKRPYFPLPLSILAGTNLIMLLLLLLLLFCNPHLIPKKIHPPFDFRENSSSFDFRENLPLPFSILVVTNLIMLLLLLLFFFSTPIWFLGKFILVWFLRKSICTQDIQQFMHAIINSV